MVPEGSHLKYEEKVAQCEERAYSIRRVTSAVGGLGLWCERKSLHYKEFHIYSVGEKAFLTRNVISAA